MKDYRQFHNDFQPFACIMTERFDNTPKNQSNYYLREENKKECRKETAQNKTDKLLTSLQRYNQSRRQAKKIELSWNLTFRSYSVIEIAQDSQVNMSLSILKILKSIIFNLSTKNIKFLRKGFYSKAHFLTGGLYFVRHCTFGR